MKPLIFVVLDTPAEVFGLTVVEAAIFLRLVKHLNTKRNGSEVWPSLARLATLSGASERTVRRTIRKLEAQDFVKVRSDRGRSNLYTVNSDVIRELADPGHSVRGSAETYPQPRSQCPITPVTVSDHPGHSVRLTANRTAERNSQVGCSMRQDISDGDQQRKLTVLGMVEGAVKKVDDVEQPTEEKARSA